MSQPPVETFTDKLVTYTIDIDGRVVVVEHVPARVSEQTGEQFFSAETVRKIREIVRGNRKPIRMMQAPVYDFAA